MVYLLYFPLLSCESSVSVKENLDRKKIDYVYGNYYGNYFKEIKKIQENTLKVH